MGWSGDISVVGALADRIADLGGLPARVTQRVSDDLAALVEDEFNAGHDPYGQPWEPLAELTLDRGRTPPPLTDSGEMRRSAKVTPAGPRVTLTVSHPAAPHQTGWSGPQGSGPARPIAPALGHGTLPPAWTQVIARAVDDEIARRVAR